VVCTHCVPLTELPAGQLKHWAGLDGFRVEPAGQAFQQVLPISVVPAAQVPRHWSGFDGLRVWPAGQVVTHCPTLAGLISVLVGLVGQFE
jgi:hypothetical protein